MAEKLKTMWLNGGRLFCSKDCAGGGIPFYFAPKAARCGDSLSGKKLKPLVCNKVVR